MAASPAPSSIKVLQDGIATLTPQYWQFWIGLFLVAFVMIGRERMTGGLRALLMKVRTMTVALETRGLSKRFGGIVATSDVSFRLERGARHALIGPNGAGKTTFVNLLTGVLPPSAGRVLLAGEDITRLRPEARVRRGLVRTFQINQLFADLTPLETLSLAVGERLGLGGDWRRPVGAVDAVSREVMDVAGRFGLGDVLDLRTDTLPYGKQRLLEIAAAFACSPQVLLLDEPAAGVPEAERRDILDAIAALPRRCVGAADRARHGPGVQFRPAHLGTGRRRAVRRGRARSDRRRCPRARRLSRREPRWLTCLPSTASPPATGGRWCCPTSRSAWAKARRWRCWAATASARPR